MENHSVRKSYSPNHPHQMEHEDHLVMMMTHAYTNILLVEGGAFRIMVTHLDISIRPISRSKFAKNLIPHKLKQAKKDFLCCFMVCTVLSFPMIFGCPRRHKRFFQYRHITRVSISRNMLALVCSSQHKLMLRFL